MNQQILRKRCSNGMVHPFPKFKVYRASGYGSGVCDGREGRHSRGQCAFRNDLPTSIFDMIEEANDYYFPAWTALYLKFTRVLILLLTVFMTPVFVLLMQNPQWIPPELSFISVRDVVNIPLVYQLLILELVIDGLRLAALNTPNMLSTPLSIFAGLVLGEFSVNSGWFNSEVMLYMAFVAVANYTQPNFELGYAVKFMRIMLLILTAALDWVGFGIGCMILIVLLSTNKTLSGRNYLNVKKK